MASKMHLLTLHSLELVGFLPSSTGVIPKLVWYLGKAETLVEWPHGNVMTDPDFYNVVPLRKPLNSPISIGLRN